MSEINGYPNRSFSENQKFVVVDPSTQTTSLVLGADVVSYITPSLNVVYSESTRVAAENVDYDVGTVVDTAGETTPGDGAAAKYLVVAGGTGDFPMLNGNDLLILEGANAAAGISYDNSISGLTANNVQDAIDEITGDAATIQYDNTTTGITATNVQDAIDETYADSAQLSGGADANFTAMPQVGGDPIIESGSNADGNWTKFADGRAIVDTGSVNLVYAGNSNYVVYAWTFPIAFVGDLPTSDFTVGETNNLSVTVTDTGWSGPAVVSKTLTSVELRQYCNNSGFMSGDFAPTVGSATGAWK